MSSYTTDAVWEPILQKPMTVSGTFLLATMPVRSHSNHLAGFHHYSLDFTSN